MGWELRRGKRVYYRKVRKAGRVRSVYCGAGERGEAAAREDEARRAGVDTLCKQNHPMETDMVAACATTESCGFTQHKKERAEIRTDKKRVGDINEAVARTRDIKKEVEAWPTVNEVIAVGRAYSTLLPRYAPHTIPREGEQLVDWYARRMEVCDEP
jgi:hypothetical protein